MIYLDYAATEMMSPEALETYTDLALNHFANAGSTHAYGRDASKLLEGFRLSCLKSLGIEKTHDLIFTSGASESNNTALKGIAFQYQNRGKRIISSSAEHASISSPLHQLRDQFGFDVVTLDAKKEGAIDPEKLREVLDSKTILVSLIGVNNETGAITPLKEVASIVSNFPKCYLHIDATQAIGKANFDYSLMDLISLSAHKFGGPKGIGLLAFRKNIRFLPLLAGGAQESGLRSGTQDLPSIGAMAVALEKAMKAPFPNPHIHLLANKVREFVKGHPDLLVLNSPESASDSIVNFSFLKHKASVVVEFLSQKGIYVSSVAACTSKKEPISNVLVSMGLSKDIAANSMRVSFIAKTTEEEVDTFLEGLEEALKELTPR